ncbi:MAG: nucleoside monophosphate kinase [Rickettsiales bacterium]|jgi:adenylate kinase|nr:nucleoside monophosphate kinase [Rickettsiales bacterium]
MKVVIFLGAPGSGKGTQSDMLVSQNNFIKISTGDLLREISSSGSDLGNKIQEIMKLGGLVSDDIVAQMLKDKLSLSKDSSVHYIFDGFPRTLNQAKILENIIKDVDSEVLVSVLLLEVDEQVVVDRIAGRFFCGDCKENYHEVYKESKVSGVCDLCGAANMQKREDDKSNIVLSRINTYNDQIKPITEFYQSRYKVKKIRAEKHYQEVYQDILSSVNI